jgi:hypothetical protein
MKLYGVRFLFIERQRPIDFDVANADELSDFDNRFRLILRKHFTILALWSILNGVSGLIGLFILTCPEPIGRGGTYYFSMMNGVWGVINFAVAIGFFYHTIYQKIRKGSAYECLVVQNHVEKMLFLNIGFDAAYIFVGFWLREHSFICALSYPDLWLGFGWAIVLQGLFLLIQDMTFLCLHRRNFRKAQPFFEAFLEGR